MAQEMQLTTGMGIGGQMTGDQQILLELKAKLAIGLCPVTNVADGTHTASPADTHNYNSLGDGSWLAKNHRPHS